MALLTSTASLDPRDYMNYTLITPKARRAAAFWEAWEWHATRTRAELRALGLTYGAKQGCFPFLPSDVRHGTWHYCTVGSYLFVDVDGRTL
jgi:hypothetical protein